MLNTLRQLLRGDDTARVSMLEHLALLGFRDPAPIVQRIRALAGSGVPSDEAAGSLFKLITLLADSADPAAGLGDFERFVQRVADRAALFRFSAKTRARSKCWCACSPAAVT